jgi:hypothetical protein
MKERSSRKGAKAQRKTRNEQIALDALAFFLCAFAPLRETNSLPAIQPLTGN